MLTPLLLCALILAHGAQGWGTTDIPTTTPTTELTSPIIYIDRGSCDNLCGQQLELCDCRSSCQTYGGCCPDYHTYCESTTIPTTTPTTDIPTTTPTTELTTSDIIIDHNSCHNLCGNVLPICSCSSSCKNYGNCCPDYHIYCESTTIPTTTPTTDYRHDHPHCYNICGQQHEHCSCSSSCENEGNCCPDYHFYCDIPTTTPTTELTTSDIIIDHNSCHNLCGNVLPICSCSSSCKNYGNCCPDYHIYCESTTIPTTIPTTDIPTTTPTTELTTSDIIIDHNSCHNLCGNVLPICSCSSSCKNYGNCCPDYHFYCESTTIPTTIPTTDPTHSHPYCHNLCGHQHEHCSCSSSCEKDGNCCHDYYMYCGSITTPRHTTGTNASTSESGRFSISGAFYKSKRFHYQITQVPYLVRLKQYLYVQVSLRRGDSTLVVFLDTCVASPSPHDFQTRSYDLIRSGCPVDSTFYSYSSGTSPYARFRFKSFWSRCATDHMYIQCKVLICPASDNNSRCRRGCSKQVGGESSSKHESQTVVLGPIQLKKPVKKAEEAQQKTKA